MSWVTEHPPARVDLDACVTCGLCLPVCPTFRLTGDETASPRGRLAAISAVDAGVLGIDERFSDVIGFCLQCRACETACPSLVPFGDIIERATAEVVAQMPSTVSRVRRFAATTGVGTPWIMRGGSGRLGIAQRPRLAGALERLGIAASGLRRIPIPLPTARGGSWGASDAPTAMLFVGCVADVWFAEIHQATIEVLLAAGYRVESPKAQTCCGALAAHDGLTDNAERMSAANSSAFASADLIVVNVAGCGSHLKADPELGSRVRDITEVVADAISDGRLATPPANGTSVAIQDPCHLEHGQGIVDAPRAVVAAAGYEVVDADRDGLCCGAAGTYLIDYPETSTELGERKAAAVRAGGTKIVASANVGCEMQLRRFLDDSYDIAHPVEFYARARRGK